MKTPFKELPYPWLFARTFHGKSTPITLTISAP